MGVLTRTETPSGKCVGGSCKDSARASRQERKGINPALFQLVGLNTDQAGRTAAVGKSELLQGETSIVLPPLPVIIAVANSYQVVAPAFDACKSPGIVTP